MDKPYADLHVHSFYSDGSLSPEEIAAAALANGVGLLAVADHDVLGGALAIRPLCDAAGIRCLPAVEIDTLDGATNFHILAYGFDTENREFGEFLRTARFLLDESSVRLVEAMERDCDGISLRDFMEYSYDRRLGGWKALHYFMERGVTASLAEGMQLYPRYGMTYDKSGYSAVAATAYRIHKAGGYAVLAHPGDTIDTSDIGAFRREVERLVARGLDGIECYYPNHSEAVTRTCLDICRRGDLLVTAGSDCHGSFFVKAHIGEMNITPDKLVLKDLLDRA